MKTPEQILSETSKAIDLAFNEVTQKRNTRKYAEGVKSQIQKRTRVGSGVSDSLKQEKLKPLSESYKLQRKGKLRFFTNKNGKVVAVSTNITAKEFRSYRPSKAARSQFKKAKEFTKVRNLDKRTRPSKSNLTATGLLLDSMKAYGERGQIIVRMLKKTYTKSIFGKLSKGPTTTEVLGYVEKDRPFFRLSRAELNGLVRRIRQDIIETAEYYRGRI